MIIKLDGQNKHYVLNNEDTINFQGSTNDNILIEINDAQRLEITGNFINVEVNVVFLNMSCNNIRIIENYTLDNAHVNIAYGNFSMNKIAVDNKVALMGANATINYHTYTLVKSIVDININLINHKHNTQANMYNYAVCLKNSKLDILATGKIQRNAFASKNHQTTKCLTFDALERVNVLPELLIDENDVEASHALSIGQMNENQMFYLQSRGLSINEISKLITIGYVMPIARILNNQDLNQLISTKVESRVNELCWM